MAFRQFDIVRSNFVDERWDDRKFARLEVWVTRLDARTAAMIEDLLHRFASSVLGRDYSALVVRNDKVGSGIVAVDEQGPVHWAGLLTLHTVGWPDLLYGGLDESVPVDSAFQPTVQVKATVYCPIQHYDATH